MLYTFRERRVKGFIIVCTELEGEVEVSYYRDLNPGLQMAEQRH